MFLNFNSDTPIFIQIADEIENAIISDMFREDQQVPSTTEISVQYKINPATVLKGIGLLADGGILYKKRGLGMFVALGAKDKIIQKRKQAFFDKYILPLVSEADKLLITKNEIFEMIKKGKKE